MAATSTTFWTYLKDNIPNHLKLFGTLALCAGLVFLVNYIRDLRTELKNQEKITSTLAQQFEQVGSKGTVVSDNATQPQGRVQNAASDTFGKEVLEYMAKQDAKIAALTTAIGRIPSENQTPITPESITKDEPAATKGSEPDANALTGYTLEEVRKKGPPLASVDLFYDPTQQDPTKAFAGTTWTHYQEDFHAAVGDWIKQKDGGYKTTFQLTRDVFKPDRNDPTKMDKVGTETIPITGATTVYTPTGLVDKSSIVTPRWTLELGLGRKTVGGVTNVEPFGTLDYRVTSKYGVFAGSADGGVVGGLSIRF